MSHILFMHIDFTFCFLFLYSSIYVNYINVLEIWTLFFISLWWVNRSVSLRDNIDQTKSSNLKKNQNDLICSCKHRCLESDED